MSKTLDNIIEAFPEESFLTADGFDNCIIGLEAMSMRLIYSKSKIVMQLVSEGLTLEEAFEHFSYNIEGSYVGQFTPIWCDDFLIQE
jgi:hypothetical protein